MKYSKEAFENTQAEMHRAEENKQSINREWNEASELEKLPLTTYYGVTGAIDYLRGRSPAQLKNKLRRLSDQAYDEALELNNRRDALEHEVAQRLADMEEAVEELKKFETEVLNK